MEKYLNDMGYYKRFVQHVLIVSYCSAICIHNFGQLPCPRFLQRFGLSCAASNHRHQLDVNKSLLKQDTPHGCRKLLSIFPQLCHRSVVYHIFLSKSAGILASIEYTGIYFLSVQLHPTYLQHFMAVMHCRFLSCLSQDFGCRPRIVRRQKPTKNSISSNTIQTPCAYQWSCTRAIVAESTF